MKIHNVRLGLATNSSSTHSLIFLPGAKDDLSPIDGPGSYGWGAFTLASRAAKRDYLAASIFSFFQREAGAAIALTIAREWSGGGEVTKESYVDHQSVVTFPREWNGKGLNHEFVMEFRDLLMKDGVTVLGGNDNGGHHSLSGGKDLGLRGGLPYEDWSCWVGRRDSRGYWTLFNRVTGAKLRVSLTENGLRAEPKKADAPELVDVKITDYCPFGCEYCYQDSTAKGQHAPLEQINSFVWALNDAQVFEVALGGGEPTMHPNFVEILDRFRMYNIVPNFTTKNWAWLEDEKQRAEILSRVGAFAFSCETRADVDRLARSLDKKLDHDCRIEKVSVQYIVGKDATPEALEGVLLACAEHRFRVTLLGYKNVGRGPAFGEKPSAGWLDVVRRVAKACHLRIGIDTALADRWWDALIEAGVPAWSMARVEGAFSCYVDAVAGTIAPSSYTGDAVKLASNFNDLCEKFAAFPAA